MKKYYPIMLDLEGKNCTVIGGGDVAERKVIKLIEYGAKVTVVSPQITKGLEKMAQEGLLKLIKREYQKGDLKGSFLVYAATEVKKVNEACRQEAKENKIILNVVDIPKLCDFIVPAIHRQGNLTITVSTDGKSPMYAKKIKKEIEDIYGEKYQVIIDLMGEIREKALTEIKDIKVRRELFYKLTYDPLLNQIEDLNIRQEKMWTIYNFYRERRWENEDN